MIWGPFESRLLCKTKRFFFNGKNISCNIAVFLKQKPSVNYTWIIIIYNQLLNQKRSKFILHHQSSYDVIVILM